MRNDKFSWGTSILCVVLFVGLIALLGAYKKVSKKLEVQMTQAVEELTSLEKDLQEHRSFLYELTE